MRKLLVPVLGAALAVLFCFVLADAQPIPGFSKTAPLSGTGSAGSPLKINSCATNEILKWNGSAWACAADGGGGGVTDGDKGDITVTASGLTWTIDAGVVTSAKLNITTTTCSAGQVLTALASGATGTCTNLAQSGVQATVATTGTIDDHAPAANVTSLLFTGASPITLNSMTGFSAGRTMILINTGGSTLTIPNNTGTTTNARFQTPTGASVVIPDNYMALAVWEGTDSRWHLTMPFGITDGDKGDITVATNGTAWTIDNATVTAPKLNIDGDKGDITIGSSATTFTIDPQAVTFAKMANVSTNTITGRITAGTGSMESLTGTQATSLLDTFSTSTTTKGLVPGSNSGGVSTCLKGDGTWGQCTADVTQTISGGTLTALGVNSTTTLLYWAPGATSVLRGIANGAAGRRFKMVVNDTSIFNLAIEDGTATAANRIMQGDALAWDFKGPVVIEFAYDTTNSRWTFGPVTQYMPKLTVATTATVTGATTLSSTLGVTGATTLSSTLGVTGASTFSSDTTHNGSINYFGDSNSDESYFRTNVYSVTTSSAANKPTISSCGTSPSSVGGSFGFIIYPGTGSPTSCTATFADAFIDTPSCVVTPTSSGTAGGGVYMSSVSTSALTITTSTGAALTGGLHVHCVGTSINAGSP